jgi:hypothetical protein
MADKRIRLLVQAEVSKAVRNLNKLEKETDDTKQSASELTSTFKNLFGAAVLGAGARSIVQTASNFESLRTRLVALKGSTEEGAKAFNAFTKIAATTPFQVQNVVEAGATLEAFGVSSEESLKSIADLAAFMGTDIVDASAAFGRAFAGGAGAADILRERGILQLIKDAEGIEDLSKLTLPEFREALERAMTDPDGKIAGATDLLAQTFSGKVSNMQDAIDQLQNAIGSRLLGNLGNFALAVREAATDMTNFVNNLTDDEISNMEDFAKTLGVMGAGYLSLSAFISIANANLGLFAKRVLVFAAAFEAINTVVKNMNLVRQKMLEVRLELAEFDLAVEKKFPNLVFGTEEENQQRVDFFKQKIKDIKEENEGVEFEKGLFTKMLLGDDDEVNVDSIIEDIEKVQNKTQELADKTKESNDAAVDGNKKKDDSNKTTLEQTLTGLAEEGKLTKDNAISTIKAKSKKSLASFIASIFESVPFPANVILAGLAGATVDKLFEPLMKFQTGGSFVTKGRTTLPIGNGVVVGDNASGMERIDVTPLPSPTSNGNNITINISAPLVDETVVDHIIPAIRRAEKLNL